MKEKKPLVAAWVEAARPRTLLASFSPVCIGCVLAWQEGVFQFVPAVLCLCVALLAQIASNFANDYYDFKKGADREDRVGPARAVASGWISPKAMFRATFLTLGIACLCGCLLLFYGGWILLPVGLLMALCVLGYSTGPYPLSYYGLGDVCVLLFYGIVPVCFTYYVQANTFSFLSFLLSLAVGFLSINILVVNNYRDYEQDKISGKRTTVVLFGKRFARIFYLTNGLLAIILTLPFIENDRRFIEIGLSFFFAVFITLWWQFIHSEGAALNKILGKTAMSVFLYALLLTAILLF
ncbi:1,4-dihydroxy-2-naphthoate polyprenyltransferase [Parabacteroides sp. 52]|uniref:1,4-dihydroxy-2-naphthoate polyprenyltransferase n=1 Tax=unclassified Parabacteroides TaxID=2649774 RepID=UPI0013D4C59E|nr:MULTISPECIES: 1,4-dihydroxy-2-naphthoate polyprenyltransferase [unclassified Parabacteroides]NDV54157.1 1,4-dihydroxy-2-naphthoate polyprenyltransferase [Parabacteroides sp. 52]